MSHSHSHANAPEHAETNDLRFAFFVNLAFTIIELIGGILTNSIAILSDALHDLGDCMSLGAAWFLSRFSDKPRDRHYSYGYRRFSLLGALINALVLTAGSVFILTQAVPRLFDPQPPSAPGMVAFAVVGVIANGIAAYRVRGGGKSGSMNAQVIGWHLMEDVLGWAAVLVVGILLLFVDAPWLDPLLSIAITLYILYNVLSNLRDTVRLFMQAVPQDVSLTDIEKRLQQIEGVSTTHHVHIWSLDGEHSVVTAHLEVPTSTDHTDCERIKDDARRALQDLQPEHVTLEIVYADEDFNVTEP